LFNCTLHKKGGPTKVQVSVWMIWFVWERYQCPSLGFKSRRSHWLCTRIGQLVVLYFYVDAELYTIT